MVRDALSGQTVTLVPDPTIEEFDADGRRPAYVVLRTQQSYTDQALLTGVARADTVRSLWYGDIFVAEQDTARSRGVGLWGPPCGPAT